MFVTCAFPGLKPIEFGKCFPSKMHWGHIHFHRDQGMTLALMGKKILKFFDFFLNHINKVNLKKKRTTKPWSYNTIWPTYFLASFGYGVWWNEFCYCICCPTFSKMLSFNAGATRVDFNIHPHGNPRHSWKKNWDPAFTFWSPVKNEHFRSMFVTCAFPGLKPIEFGKCFPSKMHWGHIHFHRDQGMTLALMGKKIWNSLIFFETY